MRRWIPAILLVALLGCKSEAGDPKKHTGYLEIAPYTAGKNTRMATVHCPDGERVLIDVHFKKDYLEFVNKRVVIVGGPPPPRPEGRLGRAPRCGVED